VGDDPPRGDLIGALPVGPYPCADGYVMLTVLLPYVGNLVRLLDDPALTGLLGADPMVVMAKPAEAKEAIDAALYVWLAERTKDEAMSAAQAMSVPLTAVYDVRDLRTSAHFRSRDAFVPVDHPRAGTLEHLGPLFRMDQGGKISRPAPLLGEHTAEVLGSLGHSPAQLAALRKSGVI
jgi:crotonobetainyl-CoA:carnitine CoA-transferase CaiB-like acyl-CoA transferase